jgi:hypothetical protein
MFALLQLTNQYKHAIYFSVNFVNKQKQKQTLEISNKT